MIKKTLTVVIPVFNEEQAFSEHFDVIINHIDSLNDYDVDVLIVNDGSRDRTDDVVKGYCDKRDNVSLLSFTRNFGKEAAIHAGLDFAKGDAVIVMDSDLQHPPELIASMLEAWREGALIVEAYKESRGKESILYRFLAKGFYRIFDRLSGLKLRNQCDFKLLDRVAVDAYKAMPERGRFFRGIVQWLGFPSVRIPFEVPDRLHGTTSWSKLRLIKYSISAITSFSALPLQFVTMLGVVTLIISAVFSGKALYDKLTGNAIGGFTTVILLILIIGSILMVSIGLVGVYIARIYEETKGRPGYVVKPQSVKQITK